MYTVVEQRISYRIETDERGKILNRTEVPYSVAAVVLATIAEQQRRVLYERGVAAKDNRGMYPKSLW